MRTFNVSLLIIISTLSVSGTFGLKLKCYVPESTTCIVQGLNSARRIDPVTSVESINSTYNVDKLVIRNQKTTFVPQHINDFFHTLKHLEISSSNLEWISQEDMRGFRGLKTLDLSNNKLELLEKGLFVFNRELETINLSNNRLNFIHDRIFSNLQRLHSIDLEHNPCTSLIYKNKDLGSREIKDIDSDYNDYDDSKKQSHDDVDSKKQSQPDYQFYFKNYSASHQSNVIIGLNTYCQSWKRAHEIYRRKYITETDELKSYLSESTHLMRSCDGNLNAALTNYRQQKLINSKKETMDNPIDSVVIKLEEDKGVCNAVVFKVPFSNASIKRESCKNFISSLVIHQKETLFLPKNLGEQFSHLNKLTVTESGLCEIDYNVLKGLHLQTLILSKNKIAELPVDTFAEQASLRELDLSFNRLQTLDDGVFAGVNFLHTLNLNNNFLTTIKMAVLQPLDGLRTLSLANNHLKFIDASLFSLFSRLKSLDLSFNFCINTDYPTFTLEDIEAVIIENCIPPVELICKTVESETSKNDGEHCQVENLFIVYPKTNISTLNGLKGPNESIKIFLADKQTIKFIPLHLSKQLPKLKRIEIQKSNLTALEKEDFVGFSELMEIVINGNNVTSIIQGTFDTIPQLQLLDLSSNNIVTLPLNIFSKLWHLHTLLLSNNLINRLYANILPPKNSIDQFRVDKNQLEVIETKTVRLLRKAKLIDFSGNICIDMILSETDNSTQSLPCIVGEIELNCSLDIDNY